METVNEDKELIIKLLDKDIMTYKNFITTIRHMSDDEFNNFFSGKKSYEYNVPRKQKFLMLVEKVENYKFILDWGYNEEYYPYLEELWINYISIEDLQNKKDKEIEIFMERCNIHFSKWPKHIKTEFKKCIQHTKETIIYKCKEMYQILKGIPKYILIKLKDVVDYLDRICFVKLKNLVEKFHLDLLATYLLGGSGMTYSCYKWVKDNVIKAGTENFFSQETFTYLGNNLKDLGKANNFMVVESFLTIGNIIWTIKDYLQIRDLAEKVNIYNDRFKNIQKCFSDHILNVNYDDILEKGVDFKVIFDRILSDINIDLKNLENLIYDINCSIDECEEKKISSRIGIASSALLTFGGVISAILTGGTSIPATIIHSVNAAGNLSCGVIHFSNLVKCSAIIKQYKKLLDEAKEERDKIRKIITDLQKKIYQLEETAKCLPKFYENDDTNYSLFSNL